MLSGFVFRYDLYGIVSHSGKSLLSGHYRAYVRVPSSSSSLTRCSLPVVQLHNIASSVVSYQTSQLLSHNNLHSVAGCSPGEEVIMTPESSDMSTARKASSSGRKSVRKKWGTSCPDAAKESLHTAWYQCNDNVVTALNAQQLLNLLKASGSNTPYILFYHKVTLSKDNLTDCSNRWQSLWRHGVVAFFHFENWCCLEILSLFVFSAEYKCAFYLKLDYLKQFDIWKETFEILSRTEFVCSWTEVNLVLRCQLFLCLLTFYNNY